MTEVLDVVQGLFEAVRAFGLPGLAGVAFGWWLQERSRRRQADFEWRVTRYSELMVSLSAFYQGGGNSRGGTGANTALQSFLGHYRRAWLYAPNDVLKAGNEFLETVRVGSLVDDTRRERAARAFVMAMRRDL